MEHAFYIRRMDTSTDSRPIRYLSAPLHQGFWFDEGAFIGGFAFCCFWGIHEMFLQEKRVLRGWFPENPKRQKGKL